MKEEDIEVYNNGNGWRIAIPLGGQRHVLETDDARSLSTAIDDALLNIAIRSCFKKVLEEELEKHK